MNRPAGAAAGPVSGAHLREAERGFVAMLRAKRFPPAWIDQNVIDLLAQASSEYAAWLTDHKPEPNPVGWLITCAYRRAINLLEAQQRRPASTSLDAVYHLADEDTPTPEQEVIDDDRQRRLREALGRLSRQDRRLISLVYFEERSVREAGRRMGWRKSAADRHHRAALNRLREIVGDDRSLLSPAGLGLAAWVALAGEPSSRLGAAIRIVPAFVQGAVGAVAETGRRLGEGLRRLLPFAETGGVAASAGAGRVAGACGAGLLVAACGLVVAGVGPQLPGQGGATPDRPPARAGADRTPPLPAERRRPAFTAEAPEERSPAPRRAEDQRGTRRVRAHERRAPHPQSERPALTSDPPAEEPVSEGFGIEAEEEPASGGDAESTPSPSHTSPPPAPPAAREASGAQVNEEFGL